MSLELAELQALLARPADDAGVQALIGRAPAEIVRDDYYGFVELKDRGISVMFQEAPWVLAPSEISDPAQLYLAAFHLHRWRHDGYAAYRGALPHGVALDDPEAEVVRKAGPPAATGGGRMSQVLARRLPRWLRYAHGAAHLQYQLDDDDRVEMATLFVPHPEAG